MFTVLHGFISVQCKTNWPFHHLFSSNSARFLSRPVSLSCFQWSSFKLPNSLFYYAEILWKLDTAGASEYKNADVFSDSITNSELLQLLSHFQLSFSLGFQAFMKCIMLNLLQKWRGICSCFCTNSNHRMCERRLPAPFHHVIPISGHWSNHKLDWLLTNNYHNVRPTASLPRGRDIMRKVSSLCKHHLRIWGRIREIRSLKIKRKRNMDKKLWHLLLNIENKYKTVR